MPYDVQLEGELQNFIAHMKARGIPEWLIADTLMIYAASESARLGWNVGQMQELFAQRMATSQRMMAYQPR